MARFARISLAGKVINIERVNDNNAPTEQAGIDFLNNLHNVQGSDPYYKQYFIDGTRKNPASIGGEYDPVRDAFIDKKPYTSWTLNETTCRWEAPTPFPGDGKKYEWNEETTSWEEID